MGNSVEKPSNKIMVDRLVQKKHIRTPLVEGVFRAVDRAMYFEVDEGEATDPYGDEPWRRGNLHLSAPCIYANVVEALNLRSGLSFLNLGSGTGYLNTIVGLLVGPNGLNHGIELHSDVVEYACKRLQQFKEQSYAIDKFDFSEPVFIEGNCVNLNPNSNYDRIYLGAACLPNLEIFMKKLIKSNGGILVMPCGPHLMRYTRLSDEEWKSEKLMDVSFTSMVGQGDNELIIDMPMSEAKSLKELCRIIIRKQLRNKTNSTDPNLLHSDNMQARQIREKEERKHLRNKQRLKAELARLDIDDTVIGGRPSLRANPSTIRSSKEDLDHRRKTRRKRGEVCCCKSRRDTSSQTCEPIRTQKPLPQKLGFSNATSSGGVMTRSASRRLENRKSGSIGEAFKVGSSSSSSDDLNQDLKEPDCRISTSSLYDSGEEGDSANRPGSEIDAGDGDLSRTRPFVHSVRGSNPFSLNSIAQELRPRILSPPELQPSQHHIAHLIDPVSSASSSSSSSPSLQNNDYDFIRKQVVRRLPSILADMHDDDLSSNESIGESNHGEFINEITTSEDSWDDFVESCSNADTTSEASWNDLHEYSYERSDNVSSSASSHLEIPNILSEMLFAKDNNEEDDDDDDDDLFDYDCIDEGSNGEPQPSTSKCKQNINCDHRSKIDQEPVASRLRSKQSIGASLPTSSSKLVPESVNKSKANLLVGQTKLNQMDRPVPSCSRNDNTNWPLNESRQSSIKRPTRCPIHNHRSHDKNNKLKNMYQKHNKTSQTVPSNPASTSSSSNVKSSSTHSSMRLSSEPTLSSHRSNQTRRGLFTGRLLYTTRLGTTISLAARHYSGWHSSFRLYERRSNVESNGTGTGATGINRTAGGQFSSTQLHKRKRPASSSDSSDAASGNLSSNRSGRSSARARYCNCTQRASGQRNDACSSNQPTDGEDRPQSPVLQPTSSMNSGAQGQSDSLARSVCATESVFRKGASLLAKAPPPASTSSSSSSSIGGRIGQRFPKPSSTSGDGRCSPALMTGNKRPNLAGHKQLAATDHERPTKANLAGRTAHPASQQETSSTSVHLRHRNHHQHHHQHHHHHHHNQQRYQQQARSALCSSARRRPKEIEAHRFRRDNGWQSAAAEDESVHIRSKRHQWRRSERSLRRRKRSANECERYHNHMSGFILQLPVPRVLHSYLNYERANFQDSK